jgi:hypothetical protein
MASDSWAGDPTTDFYEERIEKIWSVHALAWGFAGDESLGQKFSHWFQGTTSPRSWAALGDAVKFQVNRLNKSAREDAKNAGVTAELGWSALLQVVIAGYVEGQQQILETDFDGKAAVSSLPFSFLGSGRRYADVAYKAIEAYAGGFPMNQQALEIVMDTSIKWDRHNCGPPVRVVRIDGPS